MNDAKGGMKPGNARADLVATTPMFRGVFKTRRCIVPATGFYEWQGEKGAKILLPFTMLNRPVFALPGVWDEWTMPDGNTRRSLAVITTDPNIDIRPYHDRMPVILSPGDEKLWLSPSSKPDELQSLLLPVAAGELLAHPDEAFKPMRKSPL